ncbi:TatD family nuclease-associated radical SAM protein [Methanococcoides alaskense]|uniref:TatD family-associated radical SAM protein n=1 Tax=Methanococcoides alaskense TaxID=325778 RepID=A0AA90TZ84_9EURY|nr:TatD family nuclease-associated radical SAM protein [Methanococcoides alaskense]MDA0525620.1 TatD family nuclease-associated radical SAM protein [Methanococcoides alaskense]MDR6222840.1 TatD family-associated radical SAM protein [Methanococcoides alaskense]
MIEEEVNGDIAGVGTLYYEGHDNLYLNITNRCSANCIFCIRDISDGIYGYDLRLKKEPSIDEILDKLGSLDLNKYREVVFTGFGEPTIRFDVVLEVTNWLKERGMKVRLDTNGHAQLLHPERNVISELKEAGLDEVSVSLNAESKEIYDKLCQPALKNAYEAMLEFTKEAVKAGIESRMTVVGFNDVDILKCEKIAHDMGAAFHVR